MPNKTTHDADYFIAKFEAIPEEQWCTGRLRDNSGRCCASGHCGRDDPLVPTEESTALAIVLRRWDVPGINDGDYAQYPQPTPKQRILAALRDIKAKEVSDA